MREWKKSVKSSRKDFVPFALEMRGYSVMGSYMTGQRVAISALFIC